MNYKFTRTYRRGLSVENANPCQTALNKFAWLAMKDGYKYEGGLHWLEEHGFIESDSKHIGQYFKHNYADQNP